MAVSQESDIKWELWLSSPVVITGLYVLHKHFRNQNLQASPPTGK